MTNTSTPQKPSPLSVVRDAIPQELKDCPQWVCWRYWFNPARKKWTKPPYNIFTGEKDGITDSDPYVTFSEALAAYEEDGYDGIGFALTQNDPYAGIDLDHCLHDDGTIDAHALEVVKLMQSYTEISPSGTGLRIIVKGTLPAAVKLPEIEIYDRARYLTITGQVWEGHHAD